MKYSPTYIDNLPYAVTVPTNRQWDKAMSTVKQIFGNDVPSMNMVMHFEGIASWTQDKQSSEQAVYELRGFSTYVGRFCSLATLSSPQTGFRPVLIPLNPDTREPDASNLHLIPDGTILRIGSLYLDGKSIPTMYPGDDYAEKTPHTKPGTFIQIGDSALDIYSQINFMKCGDFLIADRNILKNVSWEDLDKCGLTLGRGISDPSIFQQKNGLDDLINDALSESQKQVNQKLSPEMKQTITSNIKKRLVADFER